MRRIVTAVFDDPAAAERARQSLLDLGVPPDRIGLHAESADQAEPASAHALGTEPGLPSLLDTLFLPDTDFAAHREALRRGGVVLSVEAGPEDAARIARALDTAGAADLDARETEWRRGGWSPAAMAGAATQAASGGPVGMPGTGGMDAEAARQLGSGALAGGDPRRLARREPPIGRARSYVIEAPLAEESGLPGDVATVGKGGGA